MHIVTLYTEAVPEKTNTFDVYWMTGVNTKGICRCTVTAELPRDHEVAAELYALQHLLEVANIVGHDRAGNALTITVSSSDIKKLALFKSDKEHLIPYTFFLTTRFGDAVIEVERPQRGNPSCWLPIPERTTITELVVAEPLPELIYMNGVGDVILTVHAIDRFLERHAASTRAQAWRQLRNMAKDPSIRQIRLPAAVHAEKMAKWGKSARDFYHRGTGWHFVLSESKRHPRLLTVFEKEIKDPVLVERETNKLTLSGKTVLLADVDPKMRLALIRAFHKEGADVLFSCAVAETEFNKQIIPLNVLRSKSVHGVVLELQNAWNARDLVKRTMQKYFSIDVLVCSAAPDVADNPASVQTHLLQAALPELAKRSGSVIILPSAAELHGGATEAAIQRFEALISCNKEHIKPGVRINGVSTACDDATEGAGADAVMPVEGASGTGALERVAQTAVQLAHPECDAHLKVVSVELDRQSLVA